MKRTSEAITQRVLSAIPNLCVVASFVAIAMSGLAQAAPAITPASVYCIAGTVVNAVTGEPVRRATVAVLSETNREMLQSVVTDNEGRFSLEGLVPFCWLVRVAKRR